MARDKDQGADFNPLGWMFTFSDLVTLLLTFFVMLLSMKAPDIKKIQSVFGIFSQGSTSSFSVTDKAKVEDFQRLLDSLRQPTAKEMLAEQQKLALKLDLPGAQDPRLTTSYQPDVRLKRDKRGLVITLANDVLFAQGSADLSARAKAAIHKVADMLRYSSQPISVEGHTDDIKPRGARFQTNWALSLARAEAVLKEMIAAGIRPQRLRVAALADTRPLVMGVTKGARARNRRTEIVLLLNGE